MATYRGAPEIPPENEKAYRKRKGDYSLVIPDWLQKYAEKNPKVDFGRYSIVRWRGICDFLSDRFSRALRENNGKLLHDPDIADALWRLSDEAQDMVLVYLGLLPPEEYDDSLAPDMEDIELEIRTYCHNTESYAAYAKWFNREFVDCGGAIASWVCYMDSLEHLTYFRDLKRVCAERDFGIYSPFFPDPFGVWTEGDVFYNPNLQGVFGGGGVKVQDDSYRELILLARQVCGYGREPGTYPVLATTNKGVGKWASEWVSAYDPEHQMLRFLGVELSFANAPTRWEMVKALVESKEKYGEVQLGHDWRGRWPKEGKDALNLSRYIHPLDRRLKRGGWYHLTGQPMP